MILYSSISFSSISSPILCACLSMLEAVFSMVVCSLFWSTRLSKSRLVSVCSFMMLDSTWFMASSTAFCYWLVTLMFCSVFPSDSLRLSSCADTFSSSALSSLKMMSSVVLILAIMVDCAPNFSVNSSSFLISPLMPASSLSMSALDSFSLSSLSFAVCTMESLFCIIMMDFCHLSSRLFLLASTFSISSSASLNIFLAYSVSSFCEMICAVSIFFCSSNLLLYSFMESISRSCFFLTFYMLATLSSAVKVYFFVTAMSDFSCTLQVSISWQWRMRFYSSFWALVTLALSTLDSSFLALQSSLTCDNFCSASTLNLCAMLKLSCALSQSI